MLVLGDHHAASIDAGTCATTFAEALVAAGLKTSKIGGYHYVRLADVRVGVL
jgi:hypothetical protein